MFGSFQHCLGSGVHLDEIVKAQEIIDIPVHTSKNCPEMTHAMFESRLKNACVAMTNQCPDKNQCLDVEKFAKLLQKLQDPKMESMKNSIPAMTTDAEVPHVKLCNTIRAW